MCRPCRWAALPLRNNALADGSAGARGTSSRAASRPRNFDRSKIKAVKKDERPFVGVQPQAGWMWIHDVRVCAARAAADPSGVDHNQGKTLVDVVRRPGLEPGTHGLKGRCSTN